jgi:hypothetical protein
VAALGPLPSFIVIGATKSGTTSLWRYLNAHPEVFMSAWKEPDFFSNWRRWSHGVEWYASLFEAGAGATAVGEASTSYTWFPRTKGVPLRMHRVIPNVRLIYLIRDPVDRMIATYRLWVDLKLESREINEALLENAIFLNMSRYALQIDQYLEHFDRSQLLVITSDDLAARRRETLSTTFRFIGVDPGVFPDIATREFHRRQDHRRPIHRFVRLRRTRLYSAVRRAVASESWGGRLGWRLLTRGSSTPHEAVQPSEETRRRLVELLQPDLARLPAYVGGDFDCWGLLGTSPGDAPDRPAGANLGE